MQKYVLFEKIITNLSILRYIVKSKVNVGLYDINKQLEDFYGRVLSIVLDANFVSTNGDITNFPAIDLHDVNKRISIQVTSQRTLDKVKRTIEKFDKNKMALKYDRLIIFNILSKTDHTSSVCSNDITFSMENDILDVDDLIQKIEKLPDVKLQEAYTYIESEIGYYINKNIGSNLLSSMPDYKGTAGKTYIKLHSHLNGQRSLNETVKSANELFEDLGEKSLNARRFLFVAITKNDQNRNSNLTTVGNILTSSHGFMSGDHIPALNEMSNYGYDDDCSERSERSFHIYDNCIIDGIIGAAIDKKELYEIIVDRNFTLLD